MPPSVISMKISTSRENDRASNSDNGVLLLYCAQSQDEEHIKLVGHQLLTALHYTEQPIVRYKTDKQTQNGTLATGSTSNTTYSIDNPYYVPELVKQQCIDCGVSIHVECWKTRCVTCYYLPVETKAMMKQILDLMKGGATSTVWTHSSIHQAVKGDKNILKKALQHMRRMKQLCYEYRGKYTLPTE